MSGPDIAHLWILVIASLISNIANQPAGYYPQAPQYQPQMQMHPQQQMQMHSQQYGQPFGTQLPPQYPNQGQGFQQGYQQHQMMPGFQQQQGFQQPFMPGAIQQPQMNMMGYGNTSMQMQGGGFNQSMQMQGGGFNQNYDPAKVYADSVGAKASRLDVQPVYELSIKATKLSKRSFTTKPNPMCLVFIRQTQASPSLTPFIKTEVVRKSVEPEFATKVVLPNTFRTAELTVTFKLYDVETGKVAELANEIGWVETTLKQIFSNPKQTVLRLRSNKSSSSAPELVIKFDTLMNNRDKMYFNLSGSSIKSKDFRGHSDPFIEIFKPNAQKGEILVYRTEVVDNAAHPTWQSFVLPMNSACNCDMNKSLRFVCYDWDDDGKRTYIGEFNVKLIEMRSNNPTESKTKTYSLVDTTKRGSPTGQIEVSLRIEEGPSLGGFIKGGLHLHSIVAIDFTNMNQSVQAPGSIHFMNPNFPPNVMNVFEDALLTSIPVIEPYTWGFLHKAIGFGSQLPEGVQKVFNLNSSSAPCFKYTGIQNAYRGILGTIRPGPPQDLSLAIREAIQVAKNVKTQDDYYILTIFTENDVNNVAFERANSALKEASDLPISIIILGLGDAQFVQMRKLDADLGELERAAIGRRDIVQFVKLLEYTQRQDYSGLAREMLLELPEQVVSYMLKRGYTPKSPISNGQLANVQVQFQPPPQQFAPPPQGQGGYGAPMQHQQSFQPGNNAPPNSQMQHQQSFQPGNNSLMQHQQSFQPGNNSLMQHQQSFHPTNNAPQNSFMQGQNTFPGSTPAHLDPRSSFSQNQMTPQGQTPPQYSNLDPNSVTPQMGDASQYGIPPPGAVPNDQRGAISGTDIRPTNQGNDVSHYGTQQSQAMPFGSGFTDQQPPSLSNNGQVNDPSLYGQKNTSPHSSTGSIQGSDVPHYDMQQPQSMSFGSGFTDQQPPPSLSNNGQVNDPSLYGQKNTSPHSSTGSIQGNDISPYDMHQSQSTPFGSGFTDQQPSSLSNIGQLTDDPSPYGQKRTSPYSSFDSVDQKTSLYDQASTRTGPDAPPSSLYSSTGSVDHKTYTSSSPDNQYVDLPVQPAQIDKVSVKT